MHPRSNIIFFFFTQIVVFSAFIKLRLFNPVIQVIVQILFFFSLLYSKDKWVSNDKPTFAPQYFIYFNLIHFA